MTVELSEDAAKFVAFVLQDYARRCHEHPHTKSIRDYGRRAHMLSLVFDKDVYVTTNESFFASAETPKDA